MTSGTECVERRFVADSLRALHVHLDLVHRDVAGAFDHHLYVAFPGSFGQFAHRVELGELCAVARVGEATRSQRITDRNRDVVVAEDLEHFVEVFVEWILFAVVHHPHRVQ